MTNLEEKILKKIKNKKPKSKIYFWIKKITVQAFLLLFVVFSSFSFATILENLSSKNHFDKIKEIPKDQGLEYLIIILPYVWIFLTIIFLILALLNFQKTENFYKHKIVNIFLSIILISVFAGSALFYLGAGNFVETKSQKHIPQYKKHLKNREIKKNIFLDKLEDLGVSKNQIENDPKLKQEIDYKFRENVLNKNYIFKDPEKCSVEKISCSKESIYFSDDLGCGCRDL